MDGLMGELSGRWVGFDPVEQETTTGAKRKAKGEGKVRD